jgi:hypothetical protein
MMAGKLMRWLGQQGEKVNRKRIQRLMRLMRIEDLVGVPDLAVPLLRQRVKRMSSPDEKKITRLIAQLDSDSFTLREQAAQELGRLGDLAEPALRRALADPPSLEVRSRLERLLEGLEEAETSADPFRRIREIGGHSDTGS